MALRCPPSARSSRNNSGELNCLGFWGTVTTCPPVQPTASVVREQGVQRTTPCLSPNSSTVLYRAEILLTHRCTHVLDQIGNGPEDGRGASDNLAGGIGQA